MNLNFTLIRNTDVTAATAERNPFPGRQLHMAFHRLDGDVLLSNQIEQAAM
ncbi:hypothetical protein D3C81_1080710 [compost metagenome]